MTILDLPNELLLLVAVDLSIKELYRFLSTCRRLSSLLTPHFHQFALQDVGPLTALNWAARYGHASLAEIVLSKGAGGVGDGKRQRPGPTPLRLAIEYNHPDVIRVLAKHGQQVAGAELHMAASQRSAQAIRVLLELGADMAFKGIEGDTPAHISARRGDIDSMKAFIDAGLDFHLQNRLGWTVLHEAAFSGHKAMMVFLLGHGGKKVIDVQDPRGKTPLHWALIKPPSEGIIQLLCDHGANTDLADYEGQTPLSLALGCGRPTTRVRPSLIATGVRRWRR